MPNLLSSVAPTHKRERTPAGGGEGLPAVADGGGSGLDRGDRRHAHRPGADGGTERGGVEGNDEAAEGGGALGAGGACAAVGLAASHRAVLAPRS